MPIICNRNDEFYMIFMCTFNPSIVTFNNFLEYCEWSEWYPWSGCSKDCGVGRRTRTRTILQYGNPEGVICNTEDAKEEIDCNIKDCPGRHPFFKHRYMHFPELITQKRIQNSNIQNYRLVLPF